MSRRGRGRRGGRRRRRRLLEPLHISRFATLVVDVDSGMFLAGFPIFGASHAVFPSIAGRPELPGLMVGIDVKDSLMCYAVFAGGDASCVVSPSVVARPRMLCIMAGMDQKDSYAADQKDSTHRALVVDSGSGIRRAGFFLALRLTLCFLCTRQAQMLRIMAGLNQKDCSEATLLPFFFKIPCRGAVAVSHGPDCSVDLVSTVAPGQGGRCPCYSVVLVVKIRVLAQRLFCGLADH